MRTLAFVLCIIAYSFGAHAKTLTIKPVSQLNFGTNAAGDPAKIVPSGSTENASNGSFIVNGQKNTSYTITLPANATMTTGTGGATGTITLTAFTSTPSVASGLTDASGNQTIYIGATRSALPVNQKVGTYSGTYTLTIVY